MRNEPQMTKSVEEISSMATANCLKIAISATSIGGATLLNYNHVRVASMEDDLGVIIKVRTVLECMINQELYCWRSRRLYHSLNSTLLVI